jgi:Na+/melibiose symporter-like transporter
MKWIGTKNLGMLLLAIWLIASGVLAFVQINYAQQAGMVLAALAIAAGVLLLLGR